MIGKAKNDDTITVIELYNILDKLIGEGLESVPVQHIGYYTSPIMAVDYNEQQQVVELLEQYW